MIKRTGVAFATCLGALVLAAGAWAHFIAGGSGDASAHVGSLDAPAKPSTTPNGIGRVDIAWHRALLAGGAGAAEHYYVSRYSGTSLDGYACGTSPTGTTIPASAADGSGNFTCSDSGLTSAGPYAYTVTAVYKSFSSESAKSDPVSVSLTGPLDHFVLSATTATPTAGATDNLTITAKDSSDRTVTSYTGSHSLTFSGANSIGSNKPTVTSSSGTAIGFGSSTALNFVNGVSSVSSGANGAMTLYKAETASIVVSDGTHNNGSGLSVTVSTASAASLSLAAVTTTPTAGVADNLTITARDSFGNTAAGYTGDKSLTFAGAGSIGGNNPTVTNKAGTAVSFGTPETINFNSGVASASGSNNGVMKLYKAGTGSITVSDGSIDNGSGLPVTVSSTGTATKLLLGAASTTPVAGSADNLTITAQDTFGNTEPSYTGDKSVTFSGASTAPDGTHPTVTDKNGAAVNFGTAETITFSSGVANVSGSGNGVVKLFRAEIASIGVTQGTLTNGTGLSVTVSAGSPTVFQFTNCSVNGAAAVNPCPATVNVGNSPGHVDAHVGVLDTWRNTAKVTGSPLTVTLTNSAPTNYSLTGALVIPVGASESGVFTVTHLNNSNNSTSVGTNNGGFTQASLTVAK